MKKCNKCGKIKPLSEYYKNSNQESYRSQCKQCVIKANQKNLKFSRTKYAAKRLAEKKAQSEDGMIECFLPGCTTKFKIRGGKRYCCPAHRLKGRNYGIPTAYTSQIDRGDTVDCVHYDQCLDTAAKQNMATLKCKGCKKYRKRGDSMFFFLTDTYGQKEVRHDFR